MLTTTERIPADGQAVRKARKARHDPHGGGAFVVGGIPSALVSDDRLTRAAGDIGSEAGRVHSGNTFPGADGDRAAIVSINDYVSEVCW